jgi:two-component system cell cycle response regulator
MLSPTWRLLIAEDDDTEYQRLQAWFVEGGPRAEVKRVATYEAALDALARNDVTAALLDYRLGGNRGADLARAAVARGCKVPLIVLCDDWSPELEASTRAAGAADCLPKAQVTPLLLERVIRHVVDKAQLLTMLGELAIQDELTGLYNMRELKHLLVEEISRSQRSGRHVSLVIADLDRFDEVNTTYGQEVGDQVLQAAAQFLREKVRALDRVARYGSDEFALLLPETFSSEAFDLTERLRRASARPFMLAQGREVSVSFSLGVAELPGDAETAEALIERALDALHAAKRQGGNCAVQYYTLKKA